MSCFDDLSIKRCLEDVMDKKVENESLVWIGNLVLWCWMERLLKYRNKNLWSLGF